VWILERIDLQVLYIYKYGSREIFTDEGFQNYMPSYNVLKYRCHPMFTSPSVQWIKCLDQYC